jgi:hypothetical protein
MERVSAEIDLVLVEKVSVEGQLAERVGWDRGFCYAVLAAQTASARRRIAADWLWKRRRGC